VAFSIRVPVRVPPRQDRRVGEDVCQIAFIGSDVPDDKKGGIYRRSQCETISLMGCKPPAEAPITTILFMRGARRGESATRYKRFDHIDLHPSPILCRMCV